VTELVHGDDHGEGQQKEDQRREEVHLRLRESRRGFESRPYRAVDALDLAEIR